MLLVFIHGWSTTHTHCYGELPEVLAREPGLDLAHVHLGRYISFHDEVTLDDLARALDRALRTELPGNANGRRTFSCITHSTGAPVVRTWVEKYYGAAGLDRLPLKHLVMLAPANHGSALAQLGKNRLGRIKAWFQGIEPGTGVLDWLELGSMAQRELNRRWLAYRPARHGFYPVVLTGETIDRKLYDHLNSYTGEPGSDGVIRVASANMNYRYLHLVQTDDTWRRRPVTTALVPARRIQKSPRTPFGIVPGASHVGTRMGIMRSVTEDDGNRPVVGMIQAALRVDSEAAYRDLPQQLNDLAGDKPRPVPSYTMLTWRIVDDTGAPVEDADILLLGGSSYSPDVLPEGFFQDRQRNRCSPNILTYYLRADRMQKVRQGLIGFRVVARPQGGFAGYRSAEYRAPAGGLNTLIQPDESLLVDIVLQRRVDEEAFRLEAGTGPRRSFRKVKPSGVDVP